MNVYRDKVHVSYLVDTGAEDSHGNPIYDSVEADVLANIWPIATDTSVDGTSVRVKTRYRMVLAPTVSIPSGIGNGITVSWRDYPQLLVDGSVERHYVGSKLHHYELTTQEVIG